MPLRGPRAAFVAARPEPDALTPEERSQIARAAAAARWKKDYKRVPGGVSRDSQTVADERV
jgi:hypothetical protein